MGNTIEIVNIYQALSHSMRSTHETHNCEMHNNLIKFQHLYENDHDCIILKLYARRHSLLSKFTDIRYWNELQFKSQEDITMFVLKWT